MFLAVGSYDEKIRLFNCLSWKVITEFEHKSLLTDLSDTLVFKEEEIKSMFPYKVDSTPQSTKCNHISLDKQYPQKIFSHRRYA